MSILSDARRDLTSTNSAGNQTNFRGDSYYGDQVGGIIGGRDNFNQINNVVNNNNGGAPSGSKGFDILCNNIAENALHNSGEVSGQPKCHEGTRTAVLEFLTTWASLLTSPYLIQWLNGPAGAGKSTILRSIAQLLFGKGLLLASFFFRTSERRNNSEYDISTIAYQLALSIPKTRQHIGKAIERNPRIFYLSLWEQALHLIVLPLVSIFYDPTFDSRQYPRGIIVDGLDECRGPENQEELLDVLQRVIQRVPIPLAILVVSRPEHHIRNAFDSEHLDSCSFRLALDNSFNPDADIRTYLNARFATIYQKRAMEFPSNVVWPSLEVIDTLVAKASGQFIYASTIEKFVSSPRHNPVERLDIILGAVGADSQKPFEQLDNLYSTIFGTIDNTILKPALCVLGFLFVQPLEFPRHLKGYKSRSPACLEYFLQLRTGDVRRFLYDLESLLTIHENHRNIQFFHASLSDYLVDKSRSEKYWIDSGLVCADILEHCIFHLPDDRDIQKFFALNSSFLSEKARSTPKLHQAIERCDFDKVIAASSDPIFQLDGIRYHCPIILQIAIDEPGFANAQTTFSKLIHRLHEIVTPKVAVYFQNVSLKSFLVVGTLAYTQRLHALSPKFLQEDCYLVEIADEKVEATKGLNLLRNESWPPVMWFLKFLLDDPKGVYFIDEAGHTDITLYLMRNLFGYYATHKVQPHQSDPNTIEYFGRDLITAFQHLFSKSLVRSDLVRETKKMLRSLPDKKHIPHIPQFSRAMEEYIQRAENTTWVQRNIASPSKGFKKMIKFGGLFG